MHLMPSPVLSRPVRLHCMACVACLLALCLLGGCLPKSKAWTHPKEPNPRKEDKLFEEDSTFCEDKIGPQPQGDARGPAMAACLRRLGWKPKE